MCFFPSIRINIFSLDKRLTIITDAMMMFKCMEIISHWMLFNLPLFLKNLIQSIENYMCYRSKNVKRRKFSNQFPSIRSEWISECKCIFDATVSCILNSSMPRNHWNEKRSQPQRDHFQTRELTKGS